MPKEKAPRRTLQEMSILTQQQQLYEYRKAVAGAKEERALDREYEHDLMVRQVAVLERIAAALEKE